VTFELRNFGKRIWPLTKSRLAVSYGAYLDLFALGSIQSKLTPRRYTLHLSRHIKEAN